MEKGCENCKYTLKGEEEYPCNKCIRNSVDMWEPQTNADRIRAMSDGELVEITMEYDAEYGHYICSDGKVYQDYELQEATKHEVEWLQSPIE